MKKVLVSSVLALAMSFLGAAEFSIDKTHSNVAFKVKHLSISNVNGKFKNYDAVIDFDENSGKFLALSAEIDIDSVDTDNSSRDNHLKQADFFDSAKFPKMKFEMTRFKKSGDDGKLIGNLTIKDVTKEIELDYDFGGKTTNKQGKTLIGFSLEGEIKRSDFNLAPQTSSVSISDKIKLRIDVEAVAK